MALRFSVAALVLLASCAPADRAPVILSPEAGAVDAYRSWALAQGDTFVAKAGELAEVVADPVRAQALYAPSRVPFERIAPLVETLGDFNLRIDAREGVVPDQEWRGYHRLEKLLWSSKQENVDQVAQGLVADAKLLRTQLETTTITVGSLVAGTARLLNEVGTSKMTGEEERYSRTDLWDIQASIEGAEQVWQMVSGPVRTADPELAKTLDARFSLLYGLLEVLKKNDVFRPFSEVYPKEVKALSTAVLALAEPMAQLERHYPVK